MMSAARIILALGSNTNAEENMANAQTLLKKLFPEIVFTRVLHTDPIGIESDKFLNCLAYACTCHSFRQMETAVKQIERKCGRKKPEAAKGVVRMDIDILLFGDDRYHQDDWNRPYIKILLEEINEHND